jgi:uncharacterized protein
LILKGAGGIVSEIINDSDPGHPVHTFLEENRALEKEISLLEALFKNIAGRTSGMQGPELYHAVIKFYNRLMEVEKHYQRKENLLFPLLQQHGIAAIPTTMRGKHDETRAMLKKAINQLHMGLNNNSEIRWIIPELQVGMHSILEMILKEDNILFPLCRETFSEDEWYQIYRQSPGIGFCLYDPKEEWKPWKKILSEYPENG